MSETKQPKKHRNGARHPMDGAPRTIARGRPMIPVIRITNPFNPREFVREELPWRRKATLDAYFPLVSAAPVVVSINGRIVPQDQFGATYLDKTDNVVVCPVPAGGENGKQILAVVALIAVAVFAPVAAAYLTGEWGVLAGMSEALVTAGLTVGGSVLVNSVLAPPKPSTRGAGDIKSSYGVDGAKNTSLEGIPVPVCYGRFRTAGNILGLYTENDGDDNQTLYMLISAGEGPIASISDIEINETPIADFKDVEVQTRLGLPAQTPISWFADTIVAQSKNKKLNTDWYFTETSTAVDKLRLDFVAPSGLCEMDTKTGETMYHSVVMEAEYRLKGDIAWQKLPLLTDIQSWDSAYFDGENWRDSGPAGTIIREAARQAYLKDLAERPATGDTARVPQYAETLRIGAGKRATVRRSFTTPPLATGEYELRVRRITPKSTKDNIIDDVFLGDVNEITLEKLSYPHTALLALKIKLSDQISGMPNVTYMNGGRVIDVYENGAWSAAPSTNPAWIVWDILTHYRYGGATPTARLDFAAFRAFAAHCVEQRLEWNGPIESETNIWDACQLVLRVGHSQLVNVGTRYTVVTEKASTPVMMFSVANMIEGSYRETWLGTADRANEIDVTFFDKNDSYRQRTVKVYDPAVLTSGAKQRNSAITLFGVTDYEVAYKEAQFQLNLNRYILKTVSFAAPLEAVACTVGDLVYVQHDMTDWAVAGRCDAGSTASVVQLDREVTMAGDKQYRLLLVRDAVQRATGAIANVVGNSVFLTGFAGDVPVKRLKAGALDLRVTEVFDTGSGFGVVLDTVAGLAPGMAYTLWDTDVIEERDVVNTGAAGTALTLQAPLDDAPAQFTHWMFGETAKVKKPFRIKAITGSQEYRRDITALEYRPEVYDFARYGSNVPVVPPKDGIIGPARSLTVYEETYVAGHNVVSQVVASWNAPLAGSYAGADIYVQKNGGALQKTGEVRARTSAVIEAVKGDTVLVKVVAFDLFGKRSQMELAPSASYTVIGETPPLEVGGVTGASLTWAGRDCKINWRYNATTHSYEFGSEPSGADAGSLDPQFKDYEIRVYDADGTTLRRTEYTTNNSYVYIYDKNFADGLSRRLVFEIRMRDKFNNLGAPAVLDAYNPPPRIVSLDAAATFESATIAYTHSGDPDFTGARIWLAESQALLEGSLPPDELLVYTGPDSAVLLPNLMFAHDYYYRVAAVDAFGPTELLPTAVQHFKTTHLNVEAIADGVLDGSKLIPALQARIDLIDGPADLLGSVAARILDEKVARDAAIATETTTRVSQDAALADRIDAVAVKVDNNTASIVSEQTVRADADSAMASQISAIQTKVNNNSAAITSEASTRASADSANATRIDTVSSTVDGHTTAIQTAQQSIDGLSGQYTVKIDANGYVAGFGLAVYPKDDGTHTSEFMINADKFGVIMPSYPGVHPFTIGAVNGVPRVIISNALIGDAAIQNAKIGDAQVNTLKLAGNSVTIPSYLSGNNAATGIALNQLVYAGEITVSFPDTVAVVIIANWNSLGHGSSNTRIEVREGATQLLTAEDSATDGMWESHAASNRVVLSAGTHTFSVYFGNSYGGTTDVDYYGITFLGVMR